MFFDLQGLYQRIVNYDKLYIYGVGMYSEKIVPKLYDIGLKEKIAGYVVTNNHILNRQKDGLQICSIDEVETEDVDSIFLIATSSQYEHEIEDRLKSGNYSNYVFLSHYVREDADAYFRFKDTSFNQYCENISMWYGYKKRKELGEDISEGYQKLCIEVRNMLKEKNGIFQNKKQIVFIVVALSPRIHKIIGALASKEYEIVILNMDKGGYPYSQYENNKNIMVVQCECIEEVLFEAAKLNPQLFYVRPGWLDSSIANIMLMQKKNYGKIVIDIHDIAKGCYNLPPERQWLYDIEKEALELADGVVWRYDAEDFLREKYQYHYQGKTIQFWDYCYNEFIFNEPEKGGALKLCCIDKGAECLNPVNDDMLGENGIFRYANIYDVLGKIGNRCDCEFDLYIGKISDQNLKKLEELKKEYFNLNIIIGYSPQQMIQSISKYDYGCDLYHEGIMPTDEECVEKGYTRLMGTYQVTTSNRYFDFLNAGIPIIVSSYGGSRLVKYLKKFGVVADMSLESLDIECLIKNKYLYRKNAKETKKYLAINAQIDRLIKFFNTI